MSQVYGVTPTGDLSITPAADMPGRSTPLAIAPQPLTPSQLGQPAETALLFASDDKGEDDIFGGKGDDSSDDSGSDDSGSDDSGSDDSGSDDSSDESSDDSDANDMRGGMPAMGGDSSDDSSSDEDDSAAIENAAAALEEHLGLHVDPGGTLKEFVEHLTTAAKNHKAGKDQAKEEMAGGAAQTGAGAPPPGNPPGQGGASEEQRPYLMSTGGEKVFLSTVVTMPLDQIKEDQRGTAKVAQKGYRKDTRKHKDTLGNKIDQLQANGVPKADCDVLRRKVDSYQLSLDDYGNYRQQLLDTEINTALKLAKHFKGALTFSTLMSGGTVEGIKEVAQPPGTGNASNDSILQLAASRGQAVSVGQNGSTNGANGSH